MTTHGRSWLSAPKFLKPANPQEALALVLLCLALLTLGGTIVKGVEALTAEDPWSARADHVCLDMGNEYLNAEGPPQARLRAQIEISERSLDYLRAIGKSVPLSSTLEYQSMLDQKQEVNALLRHQLALMQEHRSPSNVKERIESVLMYLYRPAAENLGLYVCGQGTGNQ